MGGNPMSDRERERLERLRQRQLADRDPDPRVKVKWKGQAARRQENLLKSLFATLPPKVKGMTLGGLVGVALGIAVEFLLPPGWALCGVAVFLLCIVLGMILGATTDQGGYME